MAGISIRDEKTGGILLFRAGLVHSLRAAKWLEAKVIGRTDPDVRTSSCSAGGRPLIPRVCLWTYPVEQIKYEAMAIRSGEGHSDSATFDGPEIGANGSYHMFFLLPAQLSTWSKHRLTAVLGWG